MAKKIIEKIENSEISDEQEQALNDVYDNEGQDWESDLDKKALKKASEFEILPQLKPKNEVIYTFEVLSKIPEKIEPENPTFSNKMFILKIKKDNMVMSINCTAISFRFALKKMMIQERIESLENKMISIQKTEGINKNGIRAFMYNVQLRK